jgi:hypothetical protein
MLGIIQKHHMLPQNGFGEYIAAHSMRKFRNGLIAVGVIIVALTFFSTAAQSATQIDGNEQNAAIKLETKSDNQKRVKVKVIPVEFRYGELVQFEITFNTHSVDLSFDPASIATLEFGHGVIVRPDKWDGAAAGGHHRSGTLVFDAIPKDAKTLKLILRDVAGVPERIFIWDLPSE